MLRSSTTALSGMEVLVCPVCGFEYVHPPKVKVAAQNQTIIIEANELRVMQCETAETLQAQQERGARIILEYQCENGHHGDLILQYRKGNTLVFHETLPPQKGLEPLWHS
jgi:hypothetical protein